MAFFKVNSVSFFSFFCSFFRPPLPPLSHYDEVAYKERRWWSVKCPHKKKESKRRRRRKLWKQVLWLFLRWFGPIPSNISLFSAE